jgi:hypothetical protein
LGLEDDLLGKKDIAGGNLMMMPGGDKPNNTDVDML